ncbi:hypothetical protein BJX70DRAFT_402565 [Aspergillus crustosus]
MRMSRPTTLLNLLLGLRTTTASATTLSPLLNKSPALPLLFSAAQCNATNLHPYSPLIQFTNTNLARAHSTFTSTSSATSTSTMSSSTQDPDFQPESDSQSSQKPLLALPDSSSATHQLDVNGDGVKLDHLGPLIVNVDGTLSRIGNWAQMTEIEQKNTLRILGKRNRERMARLKAEQAEASEGAEGN